MVDQPRIINIHLGDRTLKVETITSYDDRDAVRTTDLDAIGLKSRADDGAEWNDAIEVIIKDTDGVEIIHIRTRDGSAKVTSLVGSGHMSPTIRGYL